MTARRPDHPVANAMEGTGAMLLFVGVIAVVSLVPATLDIGRWTMVLTWFAGGDVALLALGVGLTWIGQNWNTRCRERWNSG